MPDVVSELAEYIRRGLAATDGPARARLEQLFSADGPYQDRRGVSNTYIRDAYGLANDDGVPYAGLTHPENPPTGAYGGASLVLYFAHARSIQNGRSNPALN
jgi:hypothetical protein